MGNLDEWRMEKADFDNIVDQLSKHVNQWEHMNSELRVNKEREYSMKWNK